MTSVQHTRARRDRTVELLGSVIAALCIAVALIMDSFLGWGDNQRQVLSDTVLKVMAPLLAVWVLVALVEYAYEFRSTLFVVAHCAVAVAPPIALALLHWQGRLLSPWVREQLAATPILNERGVGQSIVVLASIMAIAACAHAVRIFLYSQRVGVANFKWPSKKV